MKYGGDPRVFSVMSKVCQRPVPEVFPLLFCRSEREKRLAARVVLSTRTSKNLRPTNLKRVRSKENSYS